MLRRSVMKKTIAVHLAEQREAIAQEIMDANSIRKDEREMCLKKVKALKSSVPFPYKLISDMSPSELSAWNYTSGFEEARDEALFLIRKSGERG
jgi:hypothetical protein